MKKRKTKMSYLDPIMVNKYTWLYPEKGVLLVMREARTSSGVYIQTENIAVPWKKVLLGLRRMRAQFRSKRKTQTPLTKRSER